MSHVLPRVALAIQAMMGTPVTAHARDVGAAGLATRRFRSRSASRCPAIPAGACPGDAVGQMGAARAAVTASKPAPAWYRQVGRPRAATRAAEDHRHAGAHLRLLRSLYRHLLNHPLFPVTEMPLTALDHLVGFWPPALFLYVSLWLYVSIPPALLRSLRELLDYALAIGGVCLVGLALFPAVAHRGAPARLRPGRLSGIPRPGRGSMRRATPARRSTWRPRCSPRSGSTRPAPRDGRGPGRASRELGLGPRDRVLGDGDQAARRDRRPRRGGPGLAGAGCRPCGRPGRATACRCAPGERRARAADSRGPESSPAGVAARADRAWPRGSDGQGDPHPGPRR